MTSIRRGWMALATGACTAALGVMLTLGPAQAGDIPTPTPEALTQYFNDRKIVYRAPEYRKVVVLALIPTELANTVEVSDEDAAFLPKSCLEIRVFPQVEKFP